MLQILNTLTCSINKCKDLWFKAIHDIIIRSLMKKELSAYSILASIYSLEDDLEFWPQFIINICWLQMYILWDSGVIHLYEFYLSFIKLTTPMTSLIIQRSPKDNCVKKLWPCQYRKVPQFLSVPRGSSIPNLWIQRK